MQAREGHKETAEYLLSKGADITLTDKSGDTALDVAKTSSMIKLLNGKYIIILITVIILCNRCLDREE